MFLTGCLPANTAPVASFAVSALTGPASLTVTFDALSSYDPDGVILAYSWDYGDGLTDSEDEVSHTYATEGSYTVTLEVTDNGGKIASMQKGLTVLPPETQVPDPPAARTTCSLRPMPYCGRSAPTICLPGIHNMCDDASCALRFSCKGLDCFV